MFQRIVSKFSSSIVAAGLFSAAACGGPEPLAPQALGEAHQQNHAELQVVVGQGDLAFLEMAASTAAAQIEMGQLAVARSASPMVHDYAQYMVTYAASVQQRASSIALARGHYVSSDLRVRDTYHILRLQNLHGLDFDDKYVSYQRAGLERSTYDAQDGFAASIDSEVRELAARLANDLPEIGQLVEYVDLHRGSTGDVPGALDSVLGGASKVPPSSKEPGKAPAPTNPGQQEPPAQLPSQGPGQSPAPSPSQGPGQSPAPSPSQGPGQSK